MTASTTTVAETQMFAVEVPVIAVMALVAVAVAGFLYLRSRKKQNRLSGADPF